MTRSDREYVIGKTYGRLTVMDEAGHTPAGQRLVKAQCSCEAKTIRYVQLGNLRSGCTTSCGCVHKENTSAANTVHGHLRHDAHTPEYNAWDSMHKRCSDPSVESYPYYGGKGIRVSPKWDTFPQFLADLGPKPSDLHVLSRKDNAKDFTPENTVWMLKRDADRKKSNGRLFDVNGKTLCLEDWAAEYDIPKSTLHYRLGKGLSMREALDLGRGTRGKVLPT